MNENCFIVVPWVRDQERDEFLVQWRIESPLPEWLVLQHDKYGDGCGATKNNGIARAVELGADVVVVLDGDCYPSGEAKSLPELAKLHCDALKPQSVELYKAVTIPPSRGTPYFETMMNMPVAASMGFWNQVGDYCAVRQLAFDGCKMEYDRRTIYGRYFSLCGMNLAFKPNEWNPWCRFIDVSRFDDIWMGWLWQREAYRRGYCFNLNGPMIRHSRQSNVWKNLSDEVKYLEENETLWREIALHPYFDYDSLRKLLPV